MLRKAQPNGRIGEATVTAKCWMNGIPAHGTQALRANFADSDLIIDTEAPRWRLRAQVNKGYSPDGVQVCLTQASGDQDLHESRFKADFVALVDMDKKVGESDTHEGQLDFVESSSCLVPADAANANFRNRVTRECDCPLIKSGRRGKPTNLNVHVARETMVPFKDAWHLLGAEAAATNATRSTTARTAPDPKTFSADQGWKAS